MLPEVLHQGSDLTPGFQAAFHCPLRLGAVHIQHTDPGCHTAPMHFENTNVSQQQDETLNQKRSDISSLLIVTHFQSVA